MIDVLSALVLGFTYGIGPCTISCAPIVVPLLMASSKNRKQGVISSFVFSFGRVLSYVLLGFVTGWIGSKIDFFISKKILGIFFIILGLAVFFKFQGKCILKSRIKITGYLMSFVTGFVYGLGPCPPLIALLGMAALSKSAIAGALMGLLFGIGTIISPIIILGFFSGWIAKQKEFKQVIPYVSGAFLVIMGAIYILFG